MSSIFNPPQLYTKVGATTRDMTAASGNQSVTGLGFRPRALILDAEVDSTRYSAKGYVDNGNNAKASYMRDNGSGVLINGDGGSTALLVIGKADGTAYQSCTCTLDADGFTLAWSKIATPDAGTANIRYLAFG